MPIDNSELLNEYNRLRGGLRVNEDYYYIPPEAWYLLVAWWVPFVPSVQVKLL